MSSSYALCIRVIGIIDYQRSEPTPSCFLVVEENISWHFAHYIHHSIIDELSFLVTANGIICGFCKLFFSRPCQHSPQPRLNENDPPIRTRRTNSERWIGDSIVINNVTAPHNTHSLVHSWIIFQSDLVTENSCTVDHILRLHFVLLPC